jgi:hypothetical protein
VRVVDREGCTMALCDLQKEGHVRDVSLHRIHAVNDDEQTAAGVGLEATLELGVISVTESLGLPKGQLGAVDDGCVIELVDQDDVSRFA